MSGLSKLYKLQGTSVGITKNDIEKYKDKITQKYDVNIKQIDEKYIGGCILENESQGVFIDNTLLNMIEEKLKG